MKMKRIVKNINHKIKRGVRGKRKGLKLYKKSVRFLGVNIAGLKSRFTSFRKVLEDLDHQYFSHRKQSLRKKEILSLAVNTLFMNMLEKLEGVVA